MQPPDQPRQPERVNILDMPPKIPGTPTQPLRRAAEDLRLLAEMLVRQNAIRDRYVSRVLPGAQPSIEDFKKRIRAIITSEYGGLKGPSQNAFQVLDMFAKRAGRAGYPLYNLNLQEKFAHFLLSYVTDGMKGEGNTGTLIGDRDRTDWRGGGFFNY